MIPFRALGKTGMTVSCIGLGTVKFGRNLGVKYPHSYDLPTDNDIKNLLNDAKDFGINLLDTAPAYGNSEERLGEYFKKTKNRHDWIVVSKFGEYFLEGVSSFDFSKEAALRSIDESLHRLQTDYIDVLLVHSNGDDVNIMHQYAVFETLAFLKKSGKIRAFGMSTKTIEGGLLAVEQSDVVMVTYNPIDTKERAVISHAHTLQKGILIKKALASGHIEKMGIDTNPVEKSIHFILDEPGVSSIIIGTLNSHHLQEIANYAGSLNLNNNIT
jgi:aryl-alcohol dehydrogenase-like predicted oxidoreductase